MKRFGLIPSFLSATLFLAAGLPAQEPAMATSPTRASQRTAELLKRFDKNGDGKLDDDERADAKEAMLKEQMDRQMTRLAAAAPGGNENFRARMLEMFDRNKDGRLDEDERAAAQKFAEEKGLNEPGPMRDELLKHFDKNGNGRIDTEERPAMQDFVRERLSAATTTLNRMRPEVAELDAVVRAAIEANATQLKRFDTNGDGKLSDDEWKSARQKIYQALGPTPQEEQKRLEAVAAEIARRRQQREQAMKK